jgi:FtsP/CotA-like multicopper oxidase with cupredoxin domain
LPKPTRRTFPVLGALVVVVAVLVGFAAGRSGAGDERLATHEGRDQPSLGHAARFGDQVRAPGGPHDLDSLLNPEPALPYKPGRVREYEIVASDRTLEVADGVTFSAWTFNGTAPGPVIRATAGDLVRIKFTNAGSHPHTMHFHGIHQGNMDGVFEVVQPGDSFTYEFIARPYGMHLYHCHVEPLKKHISKGLYGAFIVDPPKPRKPAKELVMVMNGFDTDGDGENNFYTVNGKAFYYAKYPITVKRGELVRIYLANLTEFDPVNSFHLHGDLFRYYPIGRNQPLFTDIVTLAQGDRGIIELKFHYPGRFMFHAHQTEFAELGWLGFFRVVA